MHEVEDAVEATRNAQARAQTSCRPWPIGVRAFWIASGYDLLWNPRPVVEEYSTSPQFSPAGTRRAVHCSSKAVTVASSHHTASAVLNEQEGEEEGEETEWEGDGLDASVEDSEDEEDGNSQEVSGFVYFLAVQLPGRSASVTRLSFGW